MEHLPGNLTWSVFKNAASQTGGRLLLTLVRFGIAVLIVRYLGIDRFGEYSLILSLLLVTEWIVDFGLTDVAVRAMCQDPARERPLLRALAAAKAIQVVVGFAFFIGVLLAMRYPASILRSGVVAGTEVLFYGGILVYRSMFKARLAMERDVMAEVAGALVMIPLIWLACLQDAGLEVLVACYVLSRAVSFGAAAAMGHRSCSLDPRGAAAADVRWAFKAALPLGLAGLLVALYNAMDLIMLSKLADVRSVGLFSAALRLIWPVLIVVEAIGASVFPVLSSFWQRRMDDFRLTLQRALDAVILAAAGAFCLFQVGSEFLLGLIGPEMVEAAGILKLLACAVVARAVTGILAPLVIVTGRQHHALWLTVIGPTSKAALLVWLIPKYGALGAAYTWLVTDVVVGLVPTLLVTQHLIGFRLRWGVLLKAAAASAATLALCTLAGIADTFAGFAAAAFLFPALAVAFRAVSVADLLRLAGGVKARFGPGGD